MSLPETVARPIGVGVAALGPMAKAIEVLYGMGSAVNEFVDSHIESLKGSGDPTIASTGRVLEAAKFGFGLGSTSSIAILALGHLMLGNPLSAVVLAVAGPGLSNPLAMTCAAVGAIYFGWGALTAAEKGEILDRVSLGLSLGLELVRSIADFVVRTAQTLLSRKQLREFREYINTQALRVSDLAIGTGETIREVVPRWAIRLWLALPNLFRRASNPGS